MGQFLLFGLPQSTLTNRANTTFGEPLDLSKG